MAFEIKTDIPRSFQKHIVRELHSTRNENTNNRFIKRLNLFKSHARYPNIAASYDSLSKLLKIDSTQIMIGAGSDQLLKDLTICLDYESIAIPSHSYEMMTVYNQIFNKKIQQLPIKFSGNEFTLDIEEGADVIYIVSPHCPTGLSFTTSDIEKLSKRFKWVIIDQAYTNPLTLRKSLVKFDNVIITKSFSKLGGVPGLRIGYCIASTKVIQKLLAVKSLYEINEGAVEYISYITKHSEIIDYAIADYKEAFEKLSIDQTFAVHCGNFATFLDTGIFKGKQYIIDDIAFVRVTLTDVNNIDILLK